MAASEICSTDIVVLILGAPSAGKSTLVNKIVGADVAPLEMAYHGTSEVKSYFLHMEVDGIQKRIALVDTPGLLGDDGEGTDHIKVVRGISDFLANLYRRHQGKATLMVIYLLDLRLLGQQRFTETERMRWNVVLQLVGNANMPRVIFGAVNGGEDNEGFQKLSDLLKAQIPKSSSLVKLGNTAESGTEVCRLLAEKGGLQCTQPLQVQQELVIKKKKWVKTSVAGAVVRQEVGAFAKLLSWLQGLFK